MNLGGHNKLPMAALKEALLAQDCTDVQTYIQSGNVVLRCDLSSDQLTEKVGKVIFDEFGFKVPVLVRTKQEWRELVSENPFENEEVGKLHVTLFSQVPEKDLLVRLEQTDFHDDHFVLKQKCLYLKVSKGYSDSKLTNTFLEKKLKVSCTTRNWKTVLKLNELLG